MGKRHKNRRVDQEVEKAKHMPWEISGQTGWMTSSSFGFRRLNIIHLFYRGGIATMVATLDTDAIATDKTCLNGKLLIFSNNLCGPERVSMINAIECLAKNPDTPSNA